MSNEQVKLTKAQRKKTPTLKQKLFLQECNFAPQNVWRCLTPLIARACERHGWVQQKPRRAPFFDIAWFITPAGRAALSQQEERK